MDFLFIGNNLATDFVNTEVISQQGRADLLSAPESLSAWFESAGCAHGIKCSERELEEARELRAAIRRTFDRVVEAKALQASDIELLNKLANELTRVLSGSNNNYKLTYRLETASDVLALIALTCSELLASARLNSIRKCASEKCILYFVDTSKNQQRQWCSMEICGNREKVRKHYDKAKVR
jgi:predicted RNA-binding Zn ribbon-like protein